MALRCGIVGLPNVGKSTIFNALTSSKIAAENYPFCTIEPNTGIVPVPDVRLQQLAELVKPAKLTPTTVEFVDIAGLVRGASQGEGLGNQFLAHIRETDATVQVIRCFEDENVTHVDGKLDPVSDVATIETELGLADLATIEKRIDRVKRQARSGDKDAKAAAALYDGLLAHLGDGKPARSYPVAVTERTAFNECHLLTAKPILYVANVDEDGLAGNEYTRALEEAVGGNVLRLCGKIEAELAELEAEEKMMFLEEMGLAEPGLNRLIHAAYDLLGLVSFFTAGPTEVRAWTVVRGTAAPVAAGTIHTDFEKGFIRAEVIDFADYMACGGENPAKEKGKMRLEGKEYVVQDGDVIFFRVAT